MYLTFRFITESDEEYLPLILTGMLMLDWKRGPPAPLAVLELMACKCVRICKLPDCSCLANRLKCTEMCKLQTCTNQREEEEDVEVNVTLDDYDDNDDEEEE